MKISTLSESKVAVKVILSAVALASLAGCAARPPKPQFIGYGEIHKATALAHTPAELKSYAAHDAIVGGATGAAIGLAFGVTAGATVGLATGGFFAWFIPGTGPLIAVTMTAAGLAIGATMGSLIGSSHKYFEEGYVFYSYVVKMDTKQAKTIKAYNFTKFKYPLGADVGVYGVKEKNNHMFYSVKLLADHDDLINA